jgi:prepilin-type N-terminal cleavage/methylation domain-containing protein
MNAQRRIRGFNLIELLVVIGIMALLATLAMPALKGITRSDAIGAANRQLLDDVAYARRMAIRNRSTVFMVFLPRNYAQLQNNFTGPDLDRATTLLGMQFHGYALFTWRRVGEQPGQIHPTYLRDWQALPEGAFIPEWKSIPNPTDYNAAHIAGFNPDDPNDPAQRTFRSCQLPFPEADSPQRIWMSYIAFNYLGQLVQLDAAGNPNPTSVDEVIPLARGAMFFAFNEATKQYQWQAPQMTENPPDNSRNNHNFIHVDWMTGRAKVDRPELPMP